MKIEDLNLRRFFVKLQKDLVPHLGQFDLTEEKQAAQGLTALFLASDAGMIVEDAKKFVVDEGEDLGIDGLFYNPATQTLHIVQSKFRLNQNKSLDQGEALKFKRGIEKILQGNVENANEKFIRAYDAIEPALSDINTRIKICICSTSKRELEPNVRSIFEDFCSRQNEVDEAFSFHYAKFDRLFQLAKFFTPESDTDIAIPIYSFGSLKDPHRAYFGYVSGVEIADWVNRFGNSLFEQNVRFTLANSDVNDSIFYTLKNFPTNFWYFNNGITAIASDATAAPTEKEPRIVNAKAVSIVNGAQTAGMLAKAASEGIDLSKVRVQFRVMSLSGAKPGFDEEVTRANNTQNELNALDFVSLDPQQDLLKTELANLGYDYIFKRGSDTGTSLTKIEVKDAAIALACATDDIAVSVQAKCYVSGLWNNIKTPPYTVIFHQGLTGSDLVEKWRAFQYCDSKLREKRNDLDRKNSAILTHGDRFVAHCTFMLAKAQGTNLSDESSVKKLVDAVADALLETFNSVSTSYPATAFKNQKTQEELKDAVLSLLRPVQ